MIRLITQKDKPAVLEMMRVFYSSPAVFTNGSEEIFNSDIDACLSSSPYLEGYVFEENGAIMGYGMLAKSFSSEFGKQCVWIEDLYVLPEFRNKGLGGKFLQFVSQKFSNAVIRLEVEEENLKAISVYKKGGFKALPYMEMIKL